MSDPDPPTTCLGSPCIVAATRAAARRLTQLYDEIMAPSGLRMTQYHLLSEVARRASAPPTVGELAVALTMERSALGQTLRPLERNGLVTMGRDPRDGRRRPIILTEDGRRCVAAARPYWAKAHEKFELYFGTRAMTELRTTLRGIAEDPELSRSFEAATGPDDS